MSAFVVLVNMLRQMNADVIINVELDGKTETIYKGNSADARYGDLVTPYEGNSVVGFDIKDDENSECAAVTWRMVKGE